MLTMRCPICLEAVLSLPQPEIGENGELYIYRCVGVACTSFLTKAEIVEYWEQEAINRASLTEDHIALLRSGYFHFPDWIAASANKNPIWNDLVRLGYVYWNVLYKSWQLSRLACEIVQEISRQEYEAKRCPCCGAINSRESA